MVVELKIYLIRTKYRTKAKYMSGFQNMDNRLKIGK